MNSRQLSEEASGHGAGEDPTGIGTFILVSLGAGVLVKVLLKQFERVRIPYTVLLLVFGIILGSLHLGDVFLGKLTGSMEVWLDLDPVVLLVMFLPPLLFGDSYVVEWHVFRRLFSQAILLAVPGVILSTIFTAIVSIYIFPYGWGWTEGLLFGAMFSATDPVAVVSLLKELGAPETLSVLIEGESLLNDGVAFVLFIVFENQLTKRQTYTSGEVVSEVVYSSVVGIIIGLVGGFIALYFIQFIWNDPVLETTVTLVAAFGVFMVGDFLMVSGVLAVVTLGLIFAAQSISYISVEVASVMHEFWHVMEYIANTLVFVYSGVVVGEQVFKSIIIPAGADLDLPSSISSEDFGWLIVLYVALNIGRALMLLILGYPLSKLGYGFNWHSGYVVAWSGLRGAIGLVAAIILTREPTCPELFPDASNGNATAAAAFRSLAEVVEELSAESEAFNTTIPCLPLLTKDRMMFHMSGIVLLTLLINGTTTKFLVKYLKLDRQSAASRIVFEKAALRLHQHTNTAIESLKRQPNYKGADWDVVWSHMPVLSDEVLVQRTKSQYSNFHKADVASLRRKLHKVTRARYASTECLADALLAEARHRFLGLVKSSYRHQFKAGACSSWPALQIMIEAAARAQDKDTMPLNEWRDSLANLCSIPSWYRDCWPKILVRHNIRALFITRHISRGYDIATSFIEAHVSVETEFEHVTNFEIMSLVLNESRRMVREARSFLRDVESSFDEIARHVKTSIAVQRLLKDSAHFAHDMLANAEIDEKDFTAIENGIEKSLKQIHRRTGFVKIQTAEDIFRNAPFFEQVDKSVVDRCLRHAVKRIFLHGETLIERGDVKNSVFLIVRGKVKVLLRMQNLRNTTSRRPSANRSSSGGGKGGSNNSSKRSGGSGPHMPHIPLHLPHIPLVSGALAAVSHIIPQHTSSSPPTSADHVNDKDVVGDDFVGVVNGMAQANAIAKGGGGGVHGGGLPVSPVIRPRSSSTDSRRHSPPSSPLLSPSSGSAGSPNGSPQMRRARFWSNESQGSVMSNFSAASAPSTIGMMNQLQHHHDNDSTSIDSTGSSMRDGTDHIGYDYGVQQKRAQGVVGSGHGMPEYAHGVSAMGTRINPSCSDPGIHDTDGFLEDLGLRNRHDSSTDASPGKVTRLVMQSPGMRPVSVPAVSANKRLSRKLAIPGARGLAQKRRMRAQAAAMAAAAAAAYPESSAAYTNRKMRRVSSEVQVPNKRAPLPHHGSLTRAVSENAPDVEGTLDRGGDSKARSAARKANATRSETINEQQPHQQQQQATAREQHQRQQRRTRRMLRPQSLHAFAINLDTTAPGGNGSALGGSAFGGGLLHSIMHPFSSNNTSNKEHAKSAYQINASPSLSPISAWQRGGSNDSPVKSSSESPEVSGQKGLERVDSSYGGDSVRTNARRVISSAASVPHEQTESVWAVLSRGDTVGEMELIAEMPVVSTVVAESIVEAYEIKFEFLHMMFADYPDSVLERNLLQQAGLLAMESHYPQLRNAPYSLLKWILHHIEIVPPKGGVPEIMDKGKGIILRGKLLRVGNRDLEEPLIPITVFDIPSKPLTFSDGSVVLWVPKAVCALAEQTNPHNTRDGGGRPGSAHHHHGHHGSHHGGHHYGGQGGSRARSNNVQERFKSLQQSRHRDASIKAAQQNMQSLNLSQSSVDVKRSPSTSPPRRMSMSSMLGKGSRMERGGSNGGGGGGTRRGDDDMLEPLALAEEVGDNYISNISNDDSNWTEFSDVQHSRTLGNHKSSMSTINDEYGYDTDQEEEEDEEDESEVYSFASGDEMIDENDDDAQYSTAEDVPVNELDMVHLEHGSLPRVDSSSLNPSQVHISRSLRSTLNQMAISSSYRLQGGAEGDNYASGTSAGHVAVEINPDNSDVDTDADGFDARAASRAVIGGKSNQPRHASGRTALRQLTFADEDEVIE